MAAVSRFVEFSATEETFVTGTSADATENATQGSRGFVKGTGLSSGEDSFTITLNSNDQLSVNINGEGYRVITLASGTCPEKSTGALNVGNPPSPGAV